MDMLVDPDEDATVTPTQFSVAAGDEDVKSFELTALDPSHVVAGTKVKAKGGGNTYAEKPFTVVETETLTARDGNNPQYEVLATKEDPVPTEVLPVCEDEQGKATLEFDLTWAPEGYSGAGLRWEISPVQCWSFAKGVFAGSGASVTTTWTHEEGAPRQYTLTAGIDCNDNQALDAGEVTRVITMNVVRFEMYAEICAEDGRRIDDIHDKALYTVCSGWVRFGAEVTAGDGVQVSYKWDFIGGSPDQRDLTKQECDWDGPAALEKCYATVTVKLDGEGALIGTAVIRTVRPKVVRVWFKDYGGGQASGGNEHRIHDAVPDSQPEYVRVDSVLVNEPTCYTKGTRMWVEADISDYTNLTKRTNIRVKVSSMFEKRVEFRGTRSVDEKTENWSEADFDELHFDAKLPKIVRAYKDFKLSWKIEAESWQKGWVDVYTGERDRVSQVTTHNACYLICDRPKCAAAEFTYKDVPGTGTTREDHIPLAISWADGEKSEHPIARKTMTSL